MFVTPVENAARFGTVDVDPATGDIRAFREKAAVDAGLVNAGIYLIPRAFIAEIPLNRPVSIETELFPRWAAEHRLRALFAPSPLLDMGTPDGLAQTNDFLQNQLSTFHPEESP